MNADYLIVGSGLTGAVIARILADAGREVMVVDRRPHAGGNVHDYEHYSGIRIHTYGPHYFRTNSAAIWSFVNRFATFYPYQASLKSFVDGQYENWPVAQSYIRRVIGDSWQPDFKGEPSNFEEASLAMMPRLVYEKFVKGYTEKQWGVPAHTLSARLAKRFDVRADDEPRLVRHQYQGIPVEGYASMMTNILEGIPLLLNFDYLMRRKDITFRRLLLFTGPIDEFFNCDLGRLAYRGQQREQIYLPDQDKVQPCAQVNNPDLANGPHIRTLEWKQMMIGAQGNLIHGTVLTRETTVTPSDPNDFEYPFPDEFNARRYRAYRERSRGIPNLLICGRLGEYRYYDMDQAIGRAMLLAERILDGRSSGNGN